MPTDVTNDFASADVKPMMLVLCSTRLQRQYIKGDGLMQS